MESREEGSYWRINAGRSAGNWIAVYLYKDVKIQKDTDGFMKRGIISCMIDIRMNNIEEIAGFALREIDSYGMRDHLWKV